MAEEEKPNKPLMTDPAVSQDGKKAHGGSQGGSRESGRFSRKEERRTPPPPPPKKQEQR